MKKLLRLKIFAALFAFSLNALAVTASTLAVAGGIAAAAATALLIGISLTAGAVPAALVGAAAALPGVVGFLVANYQDNTPSFMQPSAMTAGPQLSVNLVPAQSSTLPSSDLLGGSAMSQTGENKRYINPTQSSAFRSPMGIQATSWNDFVNQYMQQYGGNTTLAASYPPDSPWGHGYIRTQSTTGSYSTNDVGSFTADTCPPGTSMDPSGSHLCTVATSATNPAVQATENGYQPTLNGNLDWSKNSDGSWSGVNPQTGAQLNVSADGHSITGYGTNSNGQTSAVGVQDYSDGSKNITVVPNVPVTSSSGNPDTEAVGVVYSLDSNHNITDVVTLYSPTTASGQSFDPNTYSLAPSGGGNGQTMAAQQGTDPTASSSGSGGGTGTSTGTGSGSGSCSSGDCATETTQQANKALLQQIHSDLTSTGTSPGDPTPYSGNDIQKALNDAFGPLDDLLGWRIPPHQSICPTGTFVFPYTDIEMTFDPGCDFASQNISLISFSFVIFWNLAAMFIVLRA